MPSLANRGAGVASEPSIGLITLEQEQALAAKVHQLQLEVLEQDALLAPKNTTKTYNQKIKEWKLWCQANCRPLPNPWPPVTPWTGELMPGDLVDEPKMLLFMKEVTERPAG
jgi:hypothetical protein